NMYIDDYKLSADNEVNLMPLLIDDDINEQIPRPILDDHLENSLYFANLYNTEIEESMIYSGVALDDHPHEQASLVGQSSCDNYLCHNEGTCYFSNGPKCECLSWYSGDHCERTACDKVPQVKNAMVEKSFITRNKRGTRTVSKYTIKCVTGSEVKCNGNFRSRRSLVEEPQPSYEEYTIHCSNMVWAVESFNDNKLKTSRTARML
ncbi:unnamed protein product, partial [Meganyctiphanes norvegica]